MSEHQEDGGQDEAHAATISRPGDCDLHRCDRLYGCLCELDLNDPSLDQELEHLEHVFGDAVYPELIKLLCHLQLPSEEARRCWQQVIRHREAMQSRLNESVDPRVALIDYFLQVDRRLDRPKIVELSVFEKTRASVFRDELTGLHNYRFFRGLVPRELARSRRNRTPLSLVMIDIDDFKRHNDLNGHESGNDVLVELARLLRASIRETDVAVRYGGEEFVLVLPETQKTVASELAGQACATIERSPLAMTVSMGVATHPADATEETELIRCADQAMYEAKAAGKNRVWLYGQSNRSYRRVPATLTGEFRQLSPEAHSIVTVTVGDGGLLFETDRRLEPGALVAIDLRLPPSDRCVATSARVLRTEQAPQGKYRMAVRFCEIEAEVLGSLSKLIRDARTGA
ncbi:MAG: diguanylate cyclase [Acidobacteriota bacterium]|nr:diguanylate cyclase [Acidobacteriota bacterium]